MRTLSVGRRQGPRPPAYRVLGASCLFCLAAGCLTSLQAQPTVEGEVRTADSIPIAGVRLELHRVTEESGALVDSTESDRAGRFAFTLEDGSETGPVWLIGARYEGVLYWGDPIHAAGPEPITGYAVVVFDTARVDAPVADLAIPFRHIVLTPAPDGYQVEDIIDVSGREGRTLMPASDSVPVWTTGLARGAHAVVPLEGGVPAEDLMLGAGAAGFAGPLPPSGIRVVLQYIVPGDVFELQMDHPTGRVELLVVPQPGLQLEVEGLQEGQVVGEMGASLRRYSGADLPAGHILSARMHWRQGGRRSAWLWLLAAGLLGCAAILSARRSRRLR